MDNTIIQQGTFTQPATAINQVLKIRSDIDWMKIYNITQAAASNNGYGFEYYWQRGMGSTGIMHYHPAGDHTMAVNTTANAFTLVDSSAQTLGAAIATTAASNATQVVVSTGTTTGLAVGSIVRKYETVTPQLNLQNLDFTVSAITPATNFTLGNTLSQAPGVAGGAGVYRLVARSLEEYKLFYPSVRNISNITQATSAVVTTLVDHGLVVGQRVKFSIPHAVFGMTELNGLSGTVTAVSAAGAWPQTFTVDIDTTGFTAFTYPTSANVTTYGAFSPAQVIPYAETAYSTYANKLDDAVYNQSFIGMILSAGTTSPAGNASDVVYWVAGKSFNM